ncbi:hypothetical protein NQZ68_035504 [Dissostichus eleginoides]|nr:hypothetical protein NQZ68_035504 [Dissostichus eleginoides]
MLDVVPFDRSLASQTSLQIKVCEIQADRCEAKLDSGDACLLILCPVVPPPCLRRRCGRMGAVHPDVDRPAAVAATAAITFPEVPSSY